MSEELNYTDNDENSYEKHRQLLKQSFAGKKLQHMILRF